MDAAVRSGIPVDRQHHSTLHAVGGDVRASPASCRRCASRRARRSSATRCCLSSIAAVIIGGVSMFGGAGTVIGTVIGALIIAVLTTGLVMLNVDAFWQFIVVGTVVIVAVLIDQSRDLIIGRRRGRRRAMSEAAALRPQPHQDLRRPGCGRQRELRRRARRSRGSARRQRRGQVDADQMHLRRPRSRRRRDRLRRKTGCSFASPMDARRDGIETIYQDLALANNLDVGANIFLGREVKKRHFGGLVQTLDDKHMRERSRQTLDAAADPHSRPDRADREAVGRPAPSGGDRSRGLLGRAS